MQILIAPSILAADFTRLGEQVTEAEAAGGDWLHIDVMDGQFVPNITMGAQVVAALRRITTLPLDVHLMVVEPERHIDAFARAGANHLIVHLEACPHLHHVLQMIRAAGCRAGVALNPHTPASALSEVMHMVDVVTVMTVNPGWGGQDFLTEVMAKVARLRAMIGECGHPVDLEVDGGISRDTAVTAAEAGANVLVAGSSIFNGTSTIQENVAHLREALRKAVE